jgi:small-conductance mechanosensitive channel
MAKFKVGDRVAYYGKDPAIYRKRGTVSDVSQIRGETFVTVDLDDGEEWGAPEKDWSFMNSRACNAKFKVGDKVERGQKIAEPGKGLSVAIHASISGTVTDVNEKYVVIEK